MLSATKVAVETIETKIKHKNGCKLVWNSLPNNFLVFQFTH